ncbi:signal transduction histidine kinase [Parabacteroides sp. PFB2-10]|uniref:sensor histidine kinase n=1 Tax=Parabacteroides sp. PFB2-10 TaxID=1742405 RepID=UPI0024771AEE|nr:HAMP domain-containing sensor histidine kinase [Parabacteroides sp. PFB2-10]MDH6312208.1 signal transduction histidine kinase [Parabacteroides sp. PFB2-10]
MRHSMVILKIAGIILLSLAAAYLVVKGLYFTAIMVGFGIMALGISLYREQQKSLRRMKQLISNIHYGDLNVSFPIQPGKEYEKQLIEAMNEALSAFRDRLYQSVVSEAETEAWQKLIRVLTHEIMNSIAPIISLSETVTERAEQNGMNEKDYEIMLQAIRTIHRRSKGLLDFVENYRKLTRIPVPVLQPFSVKPLFQDIQELLYAEQITFTYNVKPDTLRMNADRSLIEQVLLNLIKNAAEACKEVENPTIELEAYQREGKTVLTVFDNGEGIVAEALDKVFVPFFTTKTGGSGIGLSICRQIINRHGGTIAVDSMQGKGTLFTLKIPNQPSLS